jgi:hypothetical protein
MANPPNTAGFSVGERARQGVARALQHQQQRARPNSGDPRFFPGKATPLRGGGVCGCLVGQNCAGHAEDTVTRARSCGCIGERCDCPIPQGSRVPRHTATPTMEVDGQQQQQPSVGDNGRIPSPFSSRRLDTEPRYAGCPMPKRSRSGGPRSEPNSTLSNEPVCPCGPCPYGNTNRAAMAKHLNSEHAATAAILDATVLAGMGLGRCEVCHYICPSGHKCLRVECISQRASRDPCQPPALLHTTLSLKEVCLAPWTTILQVPSGLVSQWIPLFLDELRAFSIAPSEDTLLRVFMCSKVLLAQPFHGGRSKASAVERIVGRRIARWRTGQIQELWNDLNAAWARRNKGRKAAATVQAEREREFRKAVSLVNRGLPGKACKLLCSRGLAEGPEVMDQMRRLFPQISEKLIFPSRVRRRLNQKQCYVSSREFPVGWHLAPLV